MTDLLDISGQRVVSADESGADEATQAFIQGRAAVVDERVRVGRGNETGWVDATALPDAINSGWQIIGHEDARKRTLRREESDAASTAIGAVESAASGATLGLSTLVQRGLGGDAERMQARRKALGKAGDLIEIGAGVVGGGIGSSGLRALLPSAATTVLGEAAEAGARKLVGEGAEMLAGRVAQKVIPIAVRGATEGFVYGVGAEIDESVLGDRGLAADRLLASGLLSAAFGAVGETGIRVGLPAIASGVKSVSSDAIRKVVGSAAGVVDGGSSTVGQAMAKRGSRAWSYLTGAPEAEGERVLSRLLGGVDDRAKINTAINEMRGVTNEVAGTLTDGITAVRAAVGDAVAASSGASKLRRVAGLLPAGADDIAAPRAIQHLDDLNGRLASLRQRNAEMSHTGYVERELVEVQGWIDRAAREMADDPSAAGTFGAVERLKQDMFRRIDDMGGRRALRDPGVDSATKATIKSLSDEYGTVRKFLEDSAIWGRAGEMQAQINGAIANRFAVVRDSDSLVARMFRGDTPVDPANALTLVRRHGRDVKGQRMTSDLDAILDAEVQYLDTVAQHFDLPEEVVGKIGAARGEIAKMRTALESKAELAALADDLQVLRAAEGAGSPSMTMLSTAGPAVLGTLGLGIGGTPGMALGMLAGGITRPYTTVRSLAGIMSTLDRVGGRTAKAVDRFLTGTAGAVAKAGRGSSAGTAFAASEISAGIDALAPVTRTGGRAATVTAAHTIAQREREEDRYHRISVALARFGASPDALSRTMEPDLAQLRTYAPALAGVAGQRAAAASRFLLSKLPVSYVPPMTSRDDALVDPMARRKFLRYASAVEDPAGALDMIADGSISIEHAEAIAAVYPDMYADVQRQIMDRLAEAEIRGERLPHDQRVQLGVLFSAPTTPGLAHLREVQSVHAADPQSRQGPPGSAPQRVRGGAAKDARRSERVGSAGDRIERGLEG